MANEMTDIVFDLKGDFVPLGYPFLLWSELSKILPWLNDEVRAGILPLKGAVSDEGMLLPKRTKLAVRIPEAFTQQTMPLTGKRLDIEGHFLEIGPGKIRTIEAYPTLKAHIVESEKSEVAFLEDVERELGKLGIPCKWICGKRQTLNYGNQTISGYSLVAHDLKPEGSIRLQQLGLGNFRRFGCGIFVPHKTIAGLD